MGWLTLTPKKKIYAQWKMDQDMSGNKRLWKEVGKVKGERQKIAIGKERTGRLAVGEENLQETWKEGIF